MVTRGVQASSHEGTGLFDCPDGDGKGERHENAADQRLPAGRALRYDGGSKPQPGVEALAEQYRLIPVCPEQLGGLPTPRSPSERQGDRVVSRQGRDVTAEYRRGAEEALRLLDFFHAEGAVLKERSPSCGKGVIYDGSFSGALTEGDGVFAQLLRERGVPVYGESDIPDLLGKA